MIAPRGGRLVVGIGNPEAGDDAAGRLVARRLRWRSQGLRGAAPAVRECLGEATELMDAWSGFEDVAIVDACVAAGEPGRVHVLAADEMDRLASLQRGGRASTHAFGVCTAIALARALGTLPRRIVIYAIEGRRFDAGAEPSPEVDRAADALVTRLLEPPPVAAADDGRGDER